MAIVVWGVGGISWDVVLVVVLVVVYVGAEVGVEEGEGVCGGCGD